MNIKNIKVSKFLDVIENKKIICYGAGQVAHDMCKNYLKIAQKIDFFIDNDSAKQGVKNISGKNYNIYSNKKLFEIKAEENIVLLITTIHFAEIIIQLNKYEELKCLNCYIFLLMEELEEEYTDKICCIEKTNDFNIPKVIHYCWFGRTEKNDKIIQCIESWKRNCKDYEIIEWNESNFDVNINEYAKEAYKNKKYAFVSDFVRLYVLYKYGGIYMDTDVEVLKPLDELLYVKGFSGFENKTSIPTGIIASIKGNEWIRDQLNVYNIEKFLDENGTPLLITNVDKITKISTEMHNFIPNGKKQILKYGMVIYPKDWFCPKSYKTGIINKTKNTYTIHHFEGSWLSEEDKEKKQKLKYDFLQIMNKLKN